MSGWKVSQLIQVHPHWKRCSAVVGTPQRKLWGQEGLEARTHPQEWKLCSMLILLERWLTVGTKQYFVVVGGGRRWTWCRFLTRAPGLPRLQWLDERYVSQLIQGYNQLESNVLGPALPIPLEDHGMANYDTDLLVIGGYSNRSPIIFLLPNVTR